MGWLSIFRLVTFSFATGCGIIVASLGADITSLTETYFDLYYNFAALSIATGALTVLTLPVMLLIDFLRKGAFTSFVVVELSWLSILWVLWIATGAFVVDQTSVAFASCTYVNTLVNQACRETQAIEAFSFLAWIALLAYTVTLLVVALINTSRGAPIWTSSVRLRGSIAPAPASAPSAAYAGAGLPQHQQQPLMQQYQASPTFPQAQAHAQQYPPQPPFAQAPYGAQPHPVAPPPAGTPVSATTAASSGPVSLYPQV